MRSKRLLMMCAGAAAIGGKVASNPQPNMTSNSSPAGYTMDQSSYFFGAKEQFAWLARDGSVAAGDEWFSSGGLPQWISAGAPAPVTLSQYSILGPAGAAFAPAAWGLYGSNTPMSGGGGALVDSQTGQDTTTVAKTYTFPPATFRYWELRITAKLGGAGNNVGIAEWRMQ